MSTRRSSNGRSPHACARLVRAALLVSFLALAGARAHAQVWSGSFPLDGAQTVPPSGSSASGTGSVTLDVATNRLTWNIGFGGLSRVLAVYFSAAPEGATGPTQMQLPPFSPIVGSTIVTPAQAADLMAGRWYVNVHTQLHPPGEIRGQVLLRAPVAVPVGLPAGILAALGVAAVGIGLAHRRRRPTSPCSLDAGPRS